ncbi:MAG: alpha/beta fold hydrolase, partial [Muribaculaceae bacterium]|nr:alpha/beta fold hydrolase [Muribaculaceae bacterium]
GRQPPPPAGFGDAACPHPAVAGPPPDPGRWYVVCANILGSCYGTTGPLTPMPPTGEPLYADFPALTIRDMARAHRLLADHLGIGRVHALVGSSVGGFQALEWITDEPDRFGRLILIATDAKASPWTIAIDETQRMAILADSTFGERRPDAAAGGLAAARAIGLLSYRGPEGYNRTQQDPPADTVAATHRACTYQRHQGDKLTARYNAYSYVAILNAFDTHDCGRARGGTEAALRRIACPTIVVGISTDIVFTVPEMKRLAAAIPGAVYAQIDSAFGHDGFLVEHARLNALLTPFINNP